MTSSFLGRNSRSILLFDAGDVTTYQRQVVETGSRERFKVVRFTPDGILVRRRNPATDREEEQNPSRWSGMDEEFEPYPTGVDRALEPGVLFYLLSALDLDEDGAFTLPFYTDGEVHQARIEVGGLHQIPVSYQVVDRRGSRTIDEKRILRRVTVTPRPFGSKEGKLELLGLEGGLELFVDPEHGVPVLIRGRIKIAGQVQVELQRIQLS